MGVSIFSNLPVTRLISQRLEPTVALTLSTLFVAVAMAIPIGVLAAWKVRKWVDRVVMGFAVLGFAMPVFVLAYVLIYFFAVQWQMLPVQGYQPLKEGFGPFVESLILPSLALGITYMALIARTTRASMLEVLSQDYIRTANSKGLATDRVLLLHALKNAAVPIVTVIGIGIALLISGVVITETVFNIPGLGRLTVDAVLKRDYPVVQGLILVFAGAKVLVNLIIDISYAFLDPRIRY
jgi:peptide/nickel transport system permease protein